jgi:hypothetical protein
MYLVVDPRKKGERGERCPQPIAEKNMGVGGE